MSDILVIEESNYKSIKSVSGQRWIELQNDQGVEVDVKELCQHLLATPGINDVETLTIGFSSCLQNLEIVEAFPKLKGLFLKGDKITSLDGLEMFHNGELVVVSIDNKKRNIEKISLAPITRLLLEYKKADDFSVIGKSRSLQRLEIAISPAPNTQDWKEVPLKFLKLEGRFVELCDLSAIKTLENVNIMYSRNFERFTGDNSSIKSLFVTNCRKFDVHSLESFESLESLEIASCAREIAISDFPDLSSLRNLRFLSCKIIYDTYDLRQKFPCLVVYEPRTITDEQAIQVSKASADVTVTCNQKKYLNGVCVEGN